MCDPHPYPHPTGVLGGVAALALVAALFVLLYRQRRGSRCVVHAGTRACCGTDLPIHCTHLASARRLYGKCQCTPGCLPLFLFGEFLVNAHLPLCPRGQRTPVKPPGSIPHLNTHIASTRTCSTCDPTAEAYRIPESAGSAHVRMLGGRPHVHRTCMAP